MSRSTMYAALLTLLSTAATCGQVSGPEVRTLDGHAGSVMAVAFSPDGKTLASCSRDKTVKLWDVPTGNLRQTLAEHTADVYSVVFSPNGELLASGGGDKIVRLWSARTGKVIRTLDGHDDVVRSVAFSPDQKTIASGGADKTLRLWNALTGELQRTLVGHTGSVKSVAFSPDGKTLASGSTDRTVRLWDARTGESKAVFEGHTGSLESVCFSPDGKTLASSSEDSTVRLWDLKSARLRHVLHGHAAEVDSIAFSPDGKTLASGSKDNSIKLWDVATAELQRTQTGHAGRIESLAFSPDGKLLASGGGGGDTSVNLWELSESQERGPVISKAAGHWPQFRGPSGRGVAGAAKPLPVEFGPTRNVTWKLPIPYGCSSPCIWNDRIFLTAFDAEAKQLQTIAIDRHRGEILWRRTVLTERIEKVHEINSPATPTPATDGDAVYVYFGSYGLVCYDFDGNEKWSHPLPMPSLPFGTASSPIVAGDLVLLNVDQQGDSFLLAVDRRTGKTVWKRDRISFQRGWATPVYVESGGTGQVVVLGGQRLVAYNVTDGSERWWITGMPPFPISTPVLVSDRLFVSAADEFGESDNVVQPPPFDVFAKEHDKNGDGKIDRNEIPADFMVIKRGASDGAGEVTLQGWFFGRVDQDKDGALSRKEWDDFVGQMVKWPSEFNVVVMSVRLDGAGDVTKSHVAWRETRGVPEVPSPLCYDNRLYLVKNGGILSCRDSQTGRLIYQQRLGAGGGYYASPVAGDGKVYTASDRGVIAVIKAGDRFEVLARNNLDEPIMATPAIADGKIYVRTQQHLFCVRQLTSTSSLRRLSPTPNFSATNLSANLLQPSSRFKRAERDFFQSDIGPHDCLQVRVRE